ncbi:MFS transporter [Xanthobacter sp. TB0139]|uniref:MFS transporter n=1 Tax=Xanthobacter sp. TB0139 TaxID=3459178 RepID=UPI004039834F
MVAFSGATFGYGTASIAGVLSQLQDGFGIGVEWQQAIVACVPGSAFVGAIAASMLARKFGRRQLMLAAFLLACCAYSVLFTAPDLTILLVARAGIGIAIGLVSMVAPMYAAELTPPRYRGGVVSVFQLAVTVGILAAYAVPLAFPQWAWSSVLVMGIVPNLLGVPVVLLLPESRSSFKEGRIGLASAEEAARAERQAFFALLRRKSVLAVFILCGLLFVLQNLSGIDGILYYAPHIFEQLGFSGDGAAIMATSALGFINVCATILAILLVDRIGRRPLLIYGSLIMALGLGATLAGAALNLPMLGLLGLGAYIWAFAMSLGPLPYVLMSELFPSAVREAGIAAASATSWLFNMLVAFTFLSFVGWIGLSGVLLLFLIVCVASVIIGMAFVPETKGAALEDIEENVLAGRPIRHLGRLGE